jgi:hypothetical protein
LARKNAALEIRGIPTVGIVYKNFIHDYESSARAVGLTELPKVVVDYAYTGISPEEIRVDIDRHIEEFIAALTTPLKKVEQGKIIEKITTQAGYAAPWGTVELGPINEELVRFTGDNYAQIYDEFQKKFLDWGWGDGFPIIPPTTERVNDMLKGTSHAPEEVLTKRFYPAQGIATVKMIAIQAVMAGARPSYLPVILAAVQCMINAGEGFILTAQTTSPSTPFFWVNGPIIGELGINCSTGTLGPGAQSRVNIAVGRAARLVMMNIGGAYLGVKDMDTIGAPDKFSLVTAENEDDCAALGWPPYHVTKGFSAKDSTMTMVSSSEHDHVIGMSTDSAEGLLLSFAVKMGSAGGAEWMGGPRGGGIILLAGDDARTCIRGGFKTKESIAKFVAQNIRVPRDAFIKYFTPQATAFGQLDQMLAKYPAGQDIYPGKPENITVLRVGAMEGKDEIYGGGRGQTVKIDDWR